MEDVELGDLITFKPPGDPYIHNIISRRIRLGIVIYTKDPGQDRVAYNARLSYTEKWPEPGAHNYIILCEGCCYRIAHSAVGAWDVTVIGRYADIL